MPPVDLNTETIRCFCQKNALRWTQPVLVRLLQRNITTDDIIHALLQGEIIEYYPNDYPFPICLVLGLALRNDYLHIVCGLGESELWLITAYRPSLHEREADFKTRRAAT